jgi:hypothetical protein
MGGISYFNEIKFDFIRTVLMRYSDRGKEGIINWTEKKCIQNYFGNLEWENLLGRPGFDENKMLIQRTA